MGDRDAYFTLMDTHIGCLPLELSSIVVALKILPSLGRLWSTSCSAQVLQDMVLNRQLSAFWVQSLLHFPQKPGAPNQTVYLEFLPTFGIIVSSADFLEGKNDINLMRHWVGDVSKMAEKEIPSPRTPHTNINFDNHHGWEYLCGTRSPVKRFQYLTGAKYP